MMDECYVNHKEKYIIPIDLKTSSKYEWDFYKSFIEWSYPIQGILYTKVLEENLKKDEYFKDFKILPYYFIVINRYSLCPLVWEFTENHANSDLVYGKNKDIVIRHPFTIGEELTYYLDNKPSVPLNINKFKSNNLKEWLNKL